MLFKTQCWGLYDVFFSRGYTWFKYVLMCVWGLLSNSCLVFLLLIQTNMWNKQAHNMISTTSLWNEHVHCLGLCIETKPLIARNCMYVRSTLTEECPRVCSICHGICGINTGALRPILIVCFILLFQVSAISWNGTIFKFIFIRVSFCDYTCIWICGFYNTTSTQSNVIGSNKVFSSRSYKVFDTECFPVVRVMYNGVWMYESWRRGSITNALCGFSR